MNYTPLKHQRLITEFVIDNELAAVWAGCGLGKTAAVLDSLNHLLNDGAIDRALIVAPLRVAVLTWPNEVEKWEQFSHLRIANLRTEEGKQQWLERSTQLGVINFEMLVKTLKWMAQNKAWADHLVADESTKFKNPSGVWQKKLLTAIGFYLRKDKDRFDYRFPRRTLLSGTPMPNGVMDLFGQYRVLDKGKRLGRSIESFRSRYFTQDYNGYSYTCLPGAEETILKKVSDVTLTLKACDYLDIPPTYTQDIEVAIPAKSKTQYLELQKEYLLELQDGDIEAGSAGALVNKLLQLTSGAVYDEDKTVHPIHEGKVQAVKKFLSKHPKENVLILVAFKHEMDRLAKAIPNATRFDKEDNAIALWNRGEIPALIAHPASMAHGLNMQDGGRTMLWTTPTYDRELYDQAVARIARTGQREETYVYHLVVSGTIDEAVIEALRQKDTVQNTLLTTLTNYRKLLSGK